MHAHDAPDHSPAPPPLRSDTGPVRPAGGARRAHVPSPTAPRVLVIEDDVEGAAALALTLEILGYSVRQVHDGAHAVAAALEFRPDAIVSDIDLPNRDGFELARAFADDPAFRHTPIIALTGRVAEEDWIAALESGFTRFLAKPTAPDDLAALLADLLAPRQ